MRKVIDCLLVAALLVAVGCESGSGPNGPGKSKAAGKPKASSGSAALNPQQEAFYSIVRKRVENPAEFRIINWGQKESQGGMAWRVVEFECKAIAYVKKKPVRKAKVNVSYANDRIALVTSMDDTRKDDGELLIQWND